MNTLLFWGSFLGLMLLLGYIAKRMPALGVLLGGILLFVPIIQWLIYDKKYFYSDGSTGGLILLIVYGSVGLICFVFGIFLLTVSIRTLHGQKVNLGDDISAFTKLAAENTAQAPNVHPIIKSVAGSIWRSQRNVWLDLGVILIAIILLFIFLATR